MSTACKSPRKVAAVALEVGNRTLPRYASRFSRHDYTLPQLFACLVLRKFFCVDYRGLAAFLSDMPQLCQDLGLTKVPHFTTLQKAERKLLKDALIRRMLSQTLDLYSGPGRDDAPGHLPVAHQVERVAIDSTGFETDRCSRYFVRRRSRSPGLWQTTRYRRFAKLGIAVDCSNHLILGTHRTRGPRPDVDQLLPLLDGFCHNALPSQLVADAGYDSEGNHQLLRDSFGIESIIPPAIGRPTDKLPAGKWRWLMATDFDEEAYGQRWQAETVMFMLKRHQGESLTSRTYHTRRREMALMCVTHNCSIVRAQKGFLQGMSGEEKKL